MMMIFFLLEIDGEQHKKPVRFSGMPMEKAIDDFNLRIKRDAIKNNWANKNKIQLYRVDYKEREIKELIKNISDIIGKEFE